MRVEGYSYRNIKGRGAYRVDLRALRQRRPKIKGSASWGSIIIRECGLTKEMNGFVRRDKALITNFLSQILSLSNSLCRIIVRSRTLNKFDDYYRRGNGDTLIISAEYLLLSLYDDSGRKLAAEILMPEMESLLAVCNNIFVHRRHELALSLADFQTLDSDLVTCRANLQLLKDGHHNQDMLISETYKKILGMWIILGKYSRNRL